MSKLAKSNRLACLAIILLFASSFGATAADNPESPQRDGYPTAVLADYVLACMAANGNSFESLHQCSCSIDFIRSRVTYESYEKMQTVMQIQLDQGQRGLFYRDSSWAKNRVEAFQKIQAESTLRCF